MPEQQYIYHRVPSNMTGTMLYPLNILREKIPEIYESHNSKYVGREELTQLYIPQLDCLWNDVLFMTPIHPQEHQDVFDRFGYISRGTKFFKIPADMLDPAITKLYLYQKVIDLEDIILPRNMLDYVPSEMGNYSKIPPRALAYLESMLRKNEQFFTYHKMPHVLYKGTLDISNIEIITVHPKSTCVSQ